MLSYKNSTFPKNQSKGSFTMKVLLSPTSTGCTSGGATPNTVSPSTGYHKISPEQAKRMMDEQKDIILLDVRTPAEFAQNHIENAILIPDNELEDCAKSRLPSQNATILIYCRSGVRSQLAAYTLLAMGYTDVYDFGGILSYPYQTITD